MADVYFNGEKAVKSLSRPEDKKLFERFRNKLGFKKDIDLVTFCVSLSMVKDNNNEIYKQHLPSPKKLVGMESFDKKDIYDLIFTEYLNFKERKLKEFETYFYTGFIILKDWFEDKDPEMTNEIERFSDIFNSL